MKYFTTAKTYEKAISMLVQKRFKEIFSLCPEWKPNEIDTSQEYMRRVFIVAPDNTEWMIRVWSIENFQGGAMIIYTIYQNDENDEYKDWDDKDD